MNEAIDIVMVLVQIAVLFMLIWHGKSFTNQLRETKRDTMIKSRTQLADFYIMYLAETNEVHKNNLLAQMNYLLNTLNRLSKDLKEYMPTDDHFLTKVQNTLDEELTK